MSDKIEVTDASLVAAARSVLTKLREQATASFTLPSDPGHTDYGRGVCAGLHVAAAQLEVALNPCPLCHEVPMPEDLDYADLCDTCAESVRTGAWS